jgi:hypothetical protein
MTLRFVDSFDHYQTADMTLKWTTRTATSAGYPLIDTTAGRYSNGCLALAGFRTGGGANQPSVLIKSLGSNDRTMYAAFGIKIASAITGTLSLSFKDGATDQVFLQIETSGLLTVQRGGGTVLGTSAGALSVGTWHHVAVKFVVGDATGVSGTWGEYQVWVNGVSVLSATNVDTKVSANSYGNALQWFINANSSLATSTNTQINYVDDFWADSATNWGDQRVQVLKPSAAGASTQFTPSAGSNYDCVNDTLLDTTDYVESTVVGNIDTYTCEDVSSSATVSAVVVTMVANKTDAGARSIRGVLRIGGTNYTNGSDLALSATDTVQQGIFETNPATAGAWTAAALNGAEIGIKDAA